MSKEFVRTKDEKDCHITGCFGDFVKCCGTDRYHYRPCASVGRRVSYDGVMLSECQSGETDLSRYSLDNVDYISLVIGDNDDIFIPARQATTPAVLNIQTLRLPTEDTNPHLTTQVKFGSFGYVSPFLRYEQNFSNKFAFSAVGEYTYAENDYPYELQNGTQTINIKL